MPESTSTLTQKARNPQLGSVWAIAVTYNTGPSVNTVLQAISPQVDHVLVVDNASDQDTLSLLRAAAGDETVGLIENQTNVGLAAAQNQGIRAAIAAGADWVLLLDDDSIADPGMMAAFARVEAEHPRTFDLMAPRLAYRNCRRLPQCMIDEGGLLLRRRLMPDRGILEGPAFVIASGSLIRTPAFATVGLMREDFFIDYLDVDFCLRLIESRCRMAVVGEALLDHDLGAITEHSLLGLMPVWTTNHSASRCFTIARNRTQLWKEYGLRFPRWLLYDLYATAWQVFRITAFERGKGPKLRNILRGLACGLRWSPHPADSFR